MYWSSVVGRMLNFNSQKCFLKPAATGDITWSPDHRVIWIICISCVLLALSLLISCIRMLATEIFGQILVAGTRKFGEEMLLSSGWTLIGSNLSSPNFNSLVRAKQSFAIRYLNVVIKSLCGNLDICLNYYFQSQNSVRVLSVADRDR